LRKLEAMLAVVSEDKALIVSGNGDVIEPDDQIVAIGSGGMYALAAARMLKKYSKLSADEIAKEALLTASEICIYTNDKINIEVIDK
jgi:ATP-dependent HslUV protease subunit HslV